MVGYNKNKWEPYQLALMESLRDADVPWAEIAPRVGHPQTSCQQMMSRIHARRRHDEADRKAAHEARERAAPRIQVQPPPRLPTRPDAPFARGNTSTAKLVMDSELRARIELQGVTAGLLGDPLPGRSALDQRARASELKTPSLAGSVTRSGAAS